MKRKILIVDDEAGVLNSLKRCLRNEPYDVITAGSGSMALELLQQQHVCLIITDVNMPGMDGIDFVCRANAVSPNSIKMVLSAYADIEMVIDAVNRGHIWRYLIKPWQPEDIRVTIGNAIDYYNAQADKRKLIQELELKNQELAQWTESLEELVDRRTAHIQSELVLMRMLLNGSELELFCKAIIPFFADHFKASNVSVFSNIDNIQYFRDRHESPAVNDVMIQVRQVLTRPDVYVDDQLIIAPVVNDGHIYGGIVIRDYGVSYDNIGSEYESYLALITIALTHHAMKIQAPQMLQNIDELIKGLK